VYDITNRTSFINTEKWIDEIRTERGNNVIIVLVGNKADLSSKRSVSLDEAQEKAKQLDVLFIETSAKAGINIKKLFRTIASALPGMENISTEEGAEDSDKKDDLQSVELNKAPVYQVNSSYCNC